MSVRLIAAALLMVGAAPLHALDFDFGTLPSGETVVDVHDRRPCPETDHTCGFSPGDHLRFESAMRGRQVSQVLLRSGGGVLDEGIALGRSFRQMGLRVRVPAGAYCASSCTVAFMGGIIRSVDPGGKFLVHSASMVHDGVDDLTKNNLKRDPEIELGRLAASSYVDGRGSAVQLISYFQEMINGAPNVGALREAVRNGPDRLPYVTDGSLKRDAHRIAAEGDVIMQDIVMSLERQSITQAIENIRPSIPSLGPRAAPAIKLLETMYTSSITGVADLSQQTLYELGYINLRTP